MKQGSRLFRAEYLAMRTWLSMNKEHYSERFLESRHSSTFRERFESSVLLEMKRVTGTFARSRLRQYLHVGLFQ